MKKYLILSFCFLLACGLFNSCAKEDSPVKPISSTLDIPDVPYQYNDANFQKALIHSRNNIPSTNPMSDHTVTLGRVLFYDTRLSLNNSVSCASCHLQQKAFAADTPFSVGFEGRTTTRNSPPVMNMVMNRNFFWDASQDELEDMVLMPIRNHLEMGIEQIGDLENKLSQVDYYQPLFTKAFGTAEVNADRISKALAQFVRSMVSVNSKFDEGQNSDFTNFSPLEKLGMDLFNSPRLSCNACHGSFNFAGWSGDAANIGLELNYEDAGINNGRFKVPSLRNVALTAPYMHDGRFATLEEVIDHYDQGIQRHPALDFRLREGYPNSFSFPENAIIFVDPFSNTLFVDGEMFDIEAINNGAPKRLNLKDIEKQALIAFLKTLTDKEFVNDEKFSNPFVQ